MKPVLRLPTLLLVLAAWGPPGAWAQTCASPGKNDTISRANFNTERLGVGIATTGATISLSEGTARMSAEAGILLLVPQMQGAGTSNGTAANGRPCSHSTPNDQGSALAFCSLDITTDNYSYDYPAAL